MDFLDHLALVESQYSPIEEAEYKGRKVKLNDPIRTSENPKKKFKVYVKDPKTGNVKVIRFGDPNLSIKRDDPKRRKSYSCLLYTSPSPRDQRGSRMPSSA